MLSDRIGSKVWYGCSKTTALKGRLKSWSSWVEEQDAISFKYEDIVLYLVVHVKSARNSCVKNEKKRA